MGTSVLVGIVVDFDLHYFGQRTQSKRKSIIILRDVKLNV